MMKAEEGYISAESAKVLALAVIARAMDDLKLGIVLSPHALLEVRIGQSYKASCIRSAARFFLNEGGILDWYCGCLEDVDLIPIQERARTVALGRGMTLETMTKLRVPRPTKKELMSSSEMESYIGEVPL